MSTLDRIKKLVTHYGGNKEAVFLGAELHKIFHGLDRQAGIDTRGEKIGHFGWNGRDLYQNQVGTRLQLHEEHLARHAKYMMAGELADLPSNEYLIANAAREQEQAKIVEFLKRNYYDFVAHQIEKGEHYNVSV